MIGDAEWFALAVPFNKYQPALTTSSQTLQRIGEPLLRQVFEVFTAALVLNHQLAVQANAEIANGIGFKVRIDERKRQVGFVALILGDHLADRMAYAFVLRRVTGNGDRIVKFSQQCRAGLGQCIAAIGRPVGLKTVARAQPGQQPDNAKK